MTANRITRPNTLTDWLGHALALARSGRARPRRLTPVSALSPHLLRDLGLNPFDASAALDREKCP